MTPLLDKNTSTHSLPQLEKWAVKFGQDILAPTAFLSVLGYFLGWSVNASYYLTLGLSPSLIQKSVPEMLTSGWVELIAFVVSIAIGLGSYQIITGILEMRKANSRKLSTSMLFAFFVLFVVAIIIGVLSFYVLSFVEVRIRYLAMLGFANFLLWAAFVLGIHIDSIGRHDESKTMVPRLFRVAFPSPYLYLVILALSMVYLLSRMGVWRGSYLAQSDIDIGSSLPTVTLYSRETLPIEGYFDAATSLYVYENMRLVDTNDTYVIVLKHLPSITTTASSITTDFITYVLSRENNLMIELHR